MIRGKACQVVDGLFKLIEERGGLDYIGEDISQIEHCLQAADLARKAGADDDTVLAALLHDIGHFIPASEKLPIMITPEGVSLGQASHERVGAQYLRNLGFGDKVCQLVGAHVDAKRYLTSTSEEYYESLSDASKQSLSFQGGPFNPHEAQQYSQLPFLEEKPAVRQWDDKAKVVGLETYTLSDYRPLAVASLCRSMERRV